MITLTRDDVTPALNRLRSLDFHPVMQAMGGEFLRITQNNFTLAGAAMRPIPWVNKRDGSPATLKLHNVLSTSFQLEVTDTTATLTNPTPYAAIHQFGGEIFPKNAKALRFQSGGRWFMVKKVTMPARPFFPVLNGRLTPAAETQIAAAGQAALDRAIGNEK